MTDESGNTNQSGPADVVAAPQGFFQRLSNSFGAILFGLVFIPVACWGLWVNEGRAVLTARALTEGQGLVQAIGTERVDQAMNGRLVHVSGDVRSQRGVSDETFKLSVKGLVLQRKVEMFQWVETESGSGQDRKFTYSTQWRDSHVDSSRFRAPEGRSNGAGMRFQAATFAAADARIGPYPVGGAVSRLSAQMPYRVPQAVVDALATDRSTPYRLDDGRIFIGSDPGRPTVGNMRISYTLVPEGPASFVGRQSGNGIETYRASNGREFLLAQTGLRTTDEMFEKAQDDNASLTWLFRALGLLGMFIGFNLLFSPFKLLASFVPVLGSLVSGATGLIAAAATAILGPLVIALAWFAYRPMISVIVLALGFAIAFGLRTIRLKRNAALSTTPNPA